MPAYAKVSLVTPVFHPSDIAFVRRWSAAAPGLGGWGVRVDPDEAPEQVSVTPPGAETPLFFITRHGRDVLLERRRAGAEPEEVGRFEGLREAVLTLCRIGDEALEEIHEELEETFPRHDKR
jgi:hypothetical protein